MNFIELLQQGGYILPQYNTGQQTFQAPNTGMQSLQSMMAIDQGAQQRYMQGEQLNLQRSQNTQNIINSTIQNNLNRQTQERLQKQMDLTNAKMEYDMKKETLDRLDADREKLNKMFLSKDLAKIQKSLEDNGLDDASIGKKLSGIKGTQSFDVGMELITARRTLIASQKTGLDNMQTYNQGKKIREDAAAQIEKAKYLFDNNLMNAEVFGKFMSDLTTATDDMLKFENGQLDNLDFNSSHWAGILGAPKFLDEKLYDAKVKSDAKLDAINIKTKELAAEKSLYDMEQDKLDRPTQRLNKVFENLTSYGENIPLMSVLNKYKIPFSDNVADVMKSVQSLTEIEQKAFLDDYYEGLAKQQQLKSKATTTPTPNVNEALTAAAIKYAKNQSPENKRELDILEKTANILNPNKSAVKADEYGNYTGTDATRQYDDQGVTRDQLGQIKAIHSTIGDGAANYVVEKGESNKNKGKVKVATKSGKTFYHEVVEENDKAYIKVSKDNKGLEYLEDVLGKAEGTWYGLNQWDDYLKESAGAANVSKLNPGVIISDDKSYILIPATPYPASQSGGAEGAVGGSGIDWTKQN